MSDYVKLKEAPYISYSTPTCSTCLEELDIEDDGWICPACGTFWSYSDNHGDAGQLYEEWSGEDLPGEALSENDAQDSIRARA